MICAHCGHGALRIHVTAGQAEFLKDSCGKNQPIPNHVDRPRLRRLALGRIPANQDCPHTNQCASALRGECYRAALQGEEYSCPVARGRQHEANNPPRHRAQRSQACLRKAIRTPGTTNYQQALEAAGQRRLIE